MSEGHQQEKNQEKKRRQRIDAFCKRLGIKQVNEQGGVEFSPYRGPRESKAIRCRIKRKHSER